MNKLKKCRHGDMIYPPSDLYLGRALDVYGEYSELEVQLFQAVVRSGQMVLDLGANIGAHTVPLARLVGPYGKVLAFEPQRILYYCLCGNVALNNVNNVGCFHAAVGAAPGSVRVPELDYDQENNFGGLDLTRDYTDAPCSLVSVVPLDAMQLPQCHFIKADVEGMELPALQGAAETIRRHRPLLYVEDNKPAKSAALRAFLDSLGYAMYEHKPQLFNPDNFLGRSDNLFGKTTSDNLFCHPRDVPPPINPQDFAMTPVGRV